MEYLANCTNMLKEIDANNVLAGAIIGLAFCVVERISELEIEASNSGIKASVKFA